MVLVGPDFKKMNLVSPFHFLAYLHQSTINFFIENRFIVICAQRNAFVNYDYSLSTVKVCSDPFCNTSAL